MTKPWISVGIAVVAVAGTVIAFWPHGAPPPSPDVAQQDSPVRGLTAQEVEDLRAGRGAGFARTAELNSYPGPRHVLDMAADLDLDAEQRRTTERIFAGMQAAAKRLGAEILAREQALSAAFAGRRVRPDALDLESAAIGTLYGRLRAVHLRAHLELTAILRPDQITRYDELRGYHAGDGHAH